MNQVSDFNYELPEELIAQTPPAQRGDSRMLVVSRDRQSFADDVFSSFHKFVRAGDCLILNNTRVFPARLHGRRNSDNGAEVEVLLLRALNPEETEWRVLVRPGKRAQLGNVIVFGEHLSAKLIGRGEFGERTVRFEASQPVRDILERIGETPLPPYIQRCAATDDRERYQTVFAKERGSVAAPTAGLHFTESMLEQCRSSGAEIAYVTLHVGLGTFAPLRVETLSEIKLHEEYFEIPSESVPLLEKATRLFCVGTTSVRTIETAALRGPFRAMSGETNLFIYPGFHFRGAGAMLTNFHLPQSSLLMLVSAFAGRDLALAAYRHAVAEKYRFYSYGDCMLIE